MKKLCSLLFITIGLLSLNGCSSNEEVQPKAEEIASQIIQTIDSDTMVQLTEERLANYYNVNTADLADYSIYVDGSGGFSDEVAVLKAKDSNEVEDLKKSVEDRVASQMKAFDGYNANEYKKLEDYILTSKDNYILFVVSNDTDGAEKIFRNAFKK